MAVRFLATFLAVSLVLGACTPTPKPTPAPAPRDIIVLLPDDQGKTGSIVVAGEGGARRLSEARQAVTVEAGAPPSAPFIMSENEVRALVGPVLSALPPPPARFILYFEQGSTELTKESLDRVREVVRTIRKRASPDVAVVGHTDTVGNRAYNDRLSLKRARAAAALIVGEGVPGSIIEISSHGKNNPLVPTGDQVPEPRNRRVEVTVR